MFVGNVILSILIFSLLVASGVIFRQLYREISEDIAAQPTANDAENGRDQT